MTRTSKRSGAAAAGAWSERSRWCSSPSSCCRWCSTPNRARARRSACAYRAKTRDRFCRRRSPKPPAPAAEPAAPPKDAPATGEAPAKKPEERVAAAPQAAEPAAEKKSEREPAAPKPTGAPKPAAASEPGQAGSPKFFVQVGAFREQDKVREITGKLAAAKLPHHTEPVAIAAGTATRVRVGPYPSRQAAEEALGTLQQLGLKGARVVEQAP
ncbi:MAG: SPOR domain-containing protein [Burkholderiales bacterium]|nr:SPOR domain-containing protein [Burkholderiales bacterium]